MGSKINTFSDKGVERIRQTVKQTLGNKPGGTRDSEDRIGGGGGVRLNEFLRAQITKVSGTTDQPLYDAFAILAPSITVTNKKPISRQFGADVAMSAAKVGNLCVLIKDLNDVWQIDYVAFEKVNTTACQAEQGQGTPDTTITTSHTFYQRDRFDAIYKASIDAAYDVDNATTNQYGKKLFTFPAGYIKIIATNFDLTLSAPTITRKARLAIATADATGQTGVNFSSAYEDVAENIQSKTLSVGGVKYLRPNPAKANVANDVTNLSGLYDGTSSSGDPIELFLNLCQTNAGGWTANEQVRVQGDIWFEYVNMGDG